ncbi:MAG: hypothetical protein COW65_00225 [Cytophagales bacterium CG18_big_fil_WC_8_21_14_2_50_42_9]|nr:MAG: hypothetical protein COW65_00225 [Cytophagales bacterium CG18_big_fil_WC_8_21_14_2_50_42_9]
MKTRKIIYHLSLLIIALAIFTGCKKDPFEDVMSNERSIEAFTLAEGQIGPAVVDRATGKVMVNVLQGTDLSQIKPLIQASYKAQVSPASGEPVNFTANNNQMTYTVTAESGQSREWTVELVPFTETILGTYKVTGLVVYGGTGPEYGGAAVLKLTDKPWVWPASGGPDAELDNTLSFTYSGVTAEGNTYGTVNNNAGPDGLYANFQFIGSPETDVNNFYRKIPTGEGQWLRNYADNTVTFTFGDNTTTVGMFVGAGTEDLGNGQSKTTTDNAFAFNLSGTDDWGNIYTDYDKFVKRPRRFWVEVKKM